MDTDVIFYTQITSLVVFIASLFGIYRSLVSNKDSLIELQKEKINHLKERLVDLERQSPDALAESLSKRVQFQLLEIERLSTENEELDRKPDEEFILAVKQEISDWKDEITKKRIYKKFANTHKRRNVSGHIGSKSEKRKLLEKFVERGGTEKQWAKVLGTPIDDDFYERSLGWSITQWRQYVLSRANETHRNNPVQPTADAAAD